MKVSFFLTRPQVVGKAAIEGAGQKEGKKLSPKKASGETSIYARLCYAGFKIKWYTPERINPKFWNKETQRAKETQKFREYPEFNARLNNIESRIKNIYRAYINDNGGTIPQPDTLRKLLDLQIKKVEVKKTPAITFFGLFEEIIAQSKAGTRLNAKTGKPISKHTCKTYHTIYTHLQEFQATRKKPIDFDTIDIEFYNSYTAYLMKGKKLDSKVGKLVPVKLSTNTIGKHIQVIKLVLNEAAERGIETNPAYKSKKFKIYTEQSDSIYLKESEIKALEQLDLSDNERLERVRDLFLVGCRTGLRYGDYSILRPEQIRDGFIETTQSKTDAPVVIPIHPTVQRILNKYGGRLPTSISNQKTNDYLKELGQMIPPGGKEPILNESISKTITRGGTRVTQTFKKWELLSTHTARRSFATNEYLAGTPSITIMAITGHKSERVFLRYIKLSPSEHAKLLKMHWQKRHEMTSV